MVRATPKGAGEVTLTRSLEPIPALYEIKSPVANHPATEGLKVLQAVIERAGRTITIT
jgi:hypothetical protein